MGIYAVSVTKSASWQGHTEKWSNVYHYFLSTNLDVTLSTDLVDQIAAAEKLCHSAAVTFEDGRVWSVGGTPAQNETIVIRDLSGVGSMAATGGMNRESCVVVRCDTNRNTSTGRRIYLRKYYHSGGLTSGGSTHYEASAALSTTQTNPMKTCLETLREVSLTPGPINVQLCAPGGQLVSDSRPVTVLDYLHNRQFRN